MMEENKIGVAETEQKIPDMCDTFLNKSPEERVLALLEFGDEEKKELRKSLSPSQIASHIESFPKGSAIDPFGEPVPVQCSENEDPNKSGFGTYNPVRDECVECTRILECFALSSNTSFDAISRSIQEEREISRSIKPRTSRTPSGVPRKRKIQRFKPIEIAAQIFNIQDIYKYAKIGPVQTPDRFFKGTAERLYERPLIKLSRKAIAMPKQQYPGGRKIGQSLYHDIQGKDNAIDINDYIKIATAALGLEKALMFVVEAIHGGHAPSGWIFETTGDDKIWCEYQNPFGTPLKKDVMAICTNSGYKA